MDNNQSSLQITAAAKFYWKASASWAKFFAILGFVFLGIYLLSIFSIGESFRTLAMLSGEPSMANLMEQSTGVMVGIFVLMMVPSFFMYLFHWRFANQVREAVDNTDQVQFTNAWRNFRNHYRVFGIMAIIGVAFWLVFIIAAAAAASSAFPISD